MNRAEARQIYLSLTDKDFEDLAKNQARWKIKFWTMTAFVYLGGLFTGIAIMKTWF